MTLSKEHRCVYTGRSGKLKRSLIEFPPRLFHAVSRRSRIANKKVAAFRRNYGLDIAAEKLLPEHISHLMDDTRYLRGRYLFPSGRHKEILRFISVYKNQQGASTNVPKVIR